MSDAPRVPARPDGGPRARRSSLARVRTPVESWIVLPWSMRILRAFLGVTFLFAGVQKFLDPNFLRAGSPDFVGTQLTGFSNGTPMAPLLHLLARAPVATGVAIAVVEIGVGLATLLGIGAVAGAAVGLAISVTLWLSATWHVHPYFLGSDSIYAVAWLGLIVGTWEAEARRLAPAHMPGPIARIDGVGRREVVRGGLVAGASVVVALVARAAGAGATTSGGSGLARASGPTSAPAAGGATPSAAPGVRGRKLTSFDRLGVMEPIGFTGPGGVPAVLVRLPSDVVVAYSRVCTHAGCTVGYDPGAELLVCPCHGAEFDPSNDARAVAGPTDTPLAPIRVVVDPATGDVVLPS